MHGYFDLAYTPVWEAALRALLAIGLALSVGFERYAKGKPLDVRPYMLVSLGACIATLAVMELTVTAERDQIVSIDPAKMFNGIVSGIGFLGAGAMFRAEGLLRGAATAASVWIMGALGIACGLGLYSLALIAGGGALLILLILGPVAAALRKHVPRWKDSVAEVQEEIVDENATHRADRLES